MNQKDELLVKQVISELRGIRLALEDLVAVAGQKDDSGEPVSTGENQDRNEEREEFRSYWASKRDAK